jgi:arabinofuranan 3-O-arabinosyltransferase
MGARAARSRTRLVSGIAQAPRARPLVSLAEASGRLRFRIPPVALAYAVPSLIAGAAVQTWFREGSVLASGDLPPPVEPGTDYRAHWNQFETGTGAPSFQIVWLPYFEGLRLFAALGLDADVFQRVWLTILAAGAAAAVVFLARSVVSSPVAVAVAGLLATLNAYRLTTMFDPVPLVAMIAAAVLGGLVVRAGGDSRPRPLAFALASTLCAFTFVNPPHLALVITWVAVCVALAGALHGRPATRRVLGFLAVGVPLAVLFNLWWIVPAALAITNPTFDARYAAPGIAEWEWTHVRGDLLNVIALTSRWAWGRPEYFPFSLRLGTFPFTTLQYVPAATAWLGVVLARGRHRALAVVLFAVGVAAIWIMKGLHEPLGATNLWLYENVPGFWLLREPAKVGLVLVLVYALLAALAVTYVESASRSLGLAFGALVVVLAGVYAHPFLTGAVVPTDRPQLPSAQVRFPDQWNAAARYLERSEAAGKVVVLPHLDYYQAPSTWGYYGATFLPQLVRRPLIEDLPGGYYRDHAAGALITELEKGILTGKGNAATLLRALGARYILLRRDLVTDFPRRTFTAPELLARRLRQRGDLRLIRSFGVADLYTPAHLRDPEVYPAVPLIAAPLNSASVHGELNIGADAVLVGPSARRVLAGVRTGQVRFVEASSRVADEVARVRGGRTIVRRNVPGSFRLLVGSKSSVVSALPIEVREALADPATRLFPRFARTEPIQPTREVASRVGDCFKYDERRLGQVGIAASVNGPRSRRTLRLAAREHSACVATSVGGTQPPEALRLRLAYRTLRGQPARLCVWQEGPDACAPSPTLEHTRSWRRLDVVVPIAPLARGLRLFLYADGAGTGRTVTEYREVTVARVLRTTGLAVAPIVPLPDVSYRRVSPSKFRVRVRRAHGPFLLVTTETFAPGWRVIAPGRDTDGVRHLRINGYANGWRIPWAGSYDVTIEYAPERAASAARRLDLVIVPLALLALLWRPLRRRRRAMSAPRQP